ncbi:MAG: YkvA family protein [Pseudomonadota bacterium]
MSLHSGQTLSIELELDASDIAYFRERLDTARKAWKFHDDDKVLLGAQAAVEEALNSNPPTYIAARIGMLQILIDMIKDHDWRLEGDDRKRIQQALAYFAEAKDMIPDHIPGIGFLDDAIMIELVALELQPEIEAYRDFCANREDLAVGDADAAPLERAREDLQSRMRRRRRRRARGAAESEVITSLFHTG